tara:strand:- start:651 stop:1016 length:366 start_codon:yes stop_codon:yes gene_type:complete
MGLDQAELIDCLNRWAAWSIKCKRFPLWEYEEIVAEGWILIHGIENAYDPEKAALYTWIDRVLGYRLPAIYIKQTKMRIWKAGEGTDSIGRSSRPTTPFVNTVPLDKFFDDNIEDSRTQPE